MVVLPYLTFYSLLPAHRVSLLSRDGNVALPNLLFPALADCISLLSSNDNVALPNLLFPASS